MVMRRPYGERNCTENNRAPPAEWEVGRESPAEGPTLVCVCALWAQGLAGVCLGFCLGWLFSMGCFAFLNLFLNISAVRNDKHLADFAISFITNCQQCLQI